MIDFNYHLINARIEDKVFIYQTKCASIKKYVEAIWGWDEAAQLKYFEEDFVLPNFKEVWLDDRAIGYLEAYENNELINITEIHIVPDAQGKGIGSRIISGVVLEAKERGKKVMLGCFKENDGAVRVYQRLGFKIVDETEAHFVLEYS